MIADADLDWLRELPKPVPDTDWLPRLLDLKVDGGYRRGRYDLPQPLTAGVVQGNFWLFAREVRRDPRNFSVGLALTDIAGNEYRLWRCNGAHPFEHENDLEGSVIPATVHHVHRATARYTAAREQWHDSYAEPVDEYVDMASAVKYLARIAGLEPYGRMFL